MYYEPEPLSCRMSIVQIKNLNRRLENLANEAVHELNKTCGHELWQSIGFDAFDSLQDSELRATANYYYGQWQTVKELKEVLS